MYNICFEYLMFSKLLLYKYNNKYLITSALQVAKGRRAGNLHCVPLLEELCGCAPAVVVVAGGHYCRRDTLPQGPTYRLKGLYYLLIYKTSIKFKFQFFYIIL